MGGGADGAFAPLSGGVFPLLARGRLDPSTLGVMVGLLVLLPGGVPFLEVGVGMGLSASPSSLFLMLKCTSDSPSGSRIISRSLTCDSL